MGECQCRPAPITPAHVLAQGTTHCWDVAGISVLLSLGSLCQLTEKNELGFVVTCSAVGALLPQWE